MWKKRQLFPWVCQHQRKNISMHFATTIINMRMQIESRLHFRRAAYLYASIAECISVRICVSKYIQCWPQIRSSVIKLSWSLANDSALRLHNDMNEGNKLIIYYSYKQTYSSSGIQLKDNLEFRKEYNFDYYQINVALWESNSEIYYASLNLIKKFN